MSHAQTLGKIAAICALKAESQTLAQHLQSGAGNIELHTCGMGRDAVMQHLGRLDLSQVKGLLSWGVCGALNPQFKAGDILIPTSIVNQDRQNIECDAKWRNAVQASLTQTNLATGTLDSVIVHNDTIAETSDEKRALLNMSKADAVDMESFAIAQFANQQHLPFISIRCVVDTLNDCLPTASKFSAGQSAPDMTTIISAVTSPSQWLDLIRTGKQFDKALTSLSQTARESMNALQLPLERNFESGD